MFFNYISAATIPPFFNPKLETFNLKLATCNFQQAIRSNDAKYVHHHSTPHGNPKNLRFFGEEERMERQIPTSRDFFRVVRFDDKITAFF